MRRPESFQWTPKDLRTIFQSKNEKNLTCTSPARERLPSSERKKKKHPGAGEREKEKFRQLTIFEMRGVDGRKDHINEGAVKSTPLGAASSTRY